jgi:hypothetical protein
MSPPEEPDEAVLLELGRLTWAAINLEDVIPMVRRAIGPEPKRLERAQVSDWVNDALKTLSGWPASEIRDTASRWFGAVREALERRNSVLHSVPVTLFIRTEDGGFTAQGQALDHLPRGNGDFSRIRLAEEDLRAVRQKLADARQDWVEICAALLEEGGRFAGS